MTIFMKVQFLIRRLIWRSDCCEYQCILADPFSDENDEYLNFCSPPPQLIQTQTLNGPACHLTTLALSDPIKRTLGSHFLLPNCPYSAMERLFASGALTHSQYLVHNNKRSYLTSKLHPLSSCACACSHKHPNHHDNRPRSPSRRNKGRARGVASMSALTCPPSRHRIRCTVALRSPSRRLRKDRTGQGQDRDVFQSSPPIGTTLIYTSGRH